MNIGLSEKPGRKRGNITRGVYTPQVGEFGPLGEKRGVKQGNIYTRGGYTTREENM